MNWTKHFFRNIGLIAIVVGMSSFANACSCDSPGRTFLTSLRDFTAAFEVVEIDSFQNPRNEYHNIVLTKLKITKVFDGETDVAYLWMDNSSGTDCQRGMFADHIGQKFIITGSIFEDTRYNTFLNREEPIQALYVSTCGKTLLHINDNIVYGAINTDMDKLIDEKYQELKASDPEKADAYRDEVYHTQFHADRYQRFTLEEFYTIMEMHFEED